MELVLALAAVVVASSSVVVPFVLRHSPALPVLERYVVTLTSGETFEGLLSQVTPEVVKLVDSYALDKDSRLSVDGELFLDRSKVAYMQKPGGGK